jgi:hypothetical protein
MLSRYINVIEDATQKYGRKKVVGARWRGKWVCVLISEFADLRYPRVFGAEPKRRKIVTIFQ